MVATPWRIGTGSTFVDLYPDEVDVPYVETGGTARTVNGTLLKDRLTTPKRSWNIVLDPQAAGTDWQPLEALYLGSPGPFDFYDVTVPNMLTYDDRLMADWVTSTGTAVTASSNMRVAISASPASVQTAITTAPAAANLLAVTVNTTYTAAITVESQSSFTGALAVYGYTSTPSGTGTQQGSNTALSANGRYTCTFTTGGTIVYVELRLTRSAGSANLCDPSVWPGSADAGKGIRSVFIASASQKPANTVDQNRSGWTLALEEV